MEFRKWLLGGTVLVLSVAFVSVAVHADEPVCTQALIRAGLCGTTAGIGNGQVTVGGTVTSPGSGGGGPTATGPIGPVDPNADCLYLLASRCLAAGPGRTTPVQPITLADIARFRPDPGVDSVEPNGWMIVGLDTNFFATSGVLVRDGVLLGQPASVRFTPVAWHWTYGDGTAATRGTPGAPWAAQGIHEFDPTTTSHVYRAPGTYYIDLTIDYTAEYRFAGMPWLDVAGTLSLPANRLVAVAGDAKTVLVERECTLNPAGPGC
jgi:hypothetical protein